MVMYEVVSEESVIEKLVELSSEMLLNFSGTSGILPIVSLSSPILKISEHTTILELEEV